LLAAEESNLESLADAGTRDRGSFYRVLDRKPRFFPPRHLVLGGGPGPAHSIEPHSMRIRGIKAT
jgi:hypothetical protein